MISFKERIEGIQDLPTLEQRCWWYIMPWDTERFNPSTVYEWASHIGWFAFTARQGEPETAVAMAEEEAEKLLGFVKRETQRSYFSEELNKWLPHD